MTRKQFLKKYYRRFLLSLAILGLIVYTGYHVMGLASGSLLMTPAKTITDTQILSGEAYLFREETLLTVPAEGLVNDLAVSGYRTARGTTLAEIYPNIPGDRERAQRELDEINRGLALLEASKVPSGVTLSAASSYRSDAESAYLELRRDVRSGNLPAAAAKGDAMLTSLNRYAFLTGSADEKTAVAELTAKKQAMLSGTPQMVVNNDGSGYYYNRTYVDGGETLFTKEALESLTPSSFAQLQRAYEAGEGMPEDFAVGKMVYGFDWYLAIDFDRDATRFLATDRTFAVTFPENDGLTLQLTCINLIDGGKDRILAVFHADVTPTAFSYLRSQRVEITVSEYTGYYVPNQALVTRVEEDGTYLSGVYIFSGSTVRFRRVHILYRGDGYSIVAERGDRGSDYLNLNDLLITSGKNLYDGKVYR